MGRRSGRKQPVEMLGERTDVAFFELMEGHLPRAFSGVMRRLPSEPRCRLCRAPFGGVGGRIMRRVGFGPSRKNPSLCNTCFEKAPIGGVEMEIGVLFADVRGSTSLGETMAPSDMAALMNRFYGSAATVLARSAIIDKLVGDEVMALYQSPLLPEGWEQAMVRDASDLLAAVGFGAATEPWLQVGVGLDAGRAFVGNVGAGEVKDFTALGDVVNTAARLQSLAQAGQIVISERLFARLGHPPTDAGVMSLDLKGKRKAEPVRVIDLGPGDQEKRSAMTFIETVSEVEATGHVAEMYERDRNAFGFLPNFTQAFSARPGVYAAWQQLNGAIKAEMDLRRYELATVAAARRLRSSYCMLAHGSVLLNKFLDPEALQAVVADHRTSEIEAVEIAIMDLAEKVVDDASSVTHQDIDRLRGLGLTDAEILEVVVAAAARCFFSKTLDALGVEPDVKYSELDPELRDALTVGRPIAQD